MLSFFDKAKTWVMGAAIAALVAFSGLTYARLSITKVNLNNAENQIEELEDTKKTLEATIENNVSVISALQTAATDRAVRQRELDDAIASLNTLPVTATCGPAIGAAMDILRNQDDD